MKSATVDEIYGAANITVDKWLQLKIHFSDAEKEATIWSLAAMEVVTNHL